MGLDCSSLDLIPRLTNWGTRIKSYLTKIESNIKGLGLARFLILYMLLPSLMQLVLINYAKSGSIKTLWDLSLCDLESWALNLHF